MHLITKEAIIWITFKKGYLITSLNIREIDILNMKKFKSKPKNLAFLAYRLIKPIFDPILFFHGIYGYTWFIRDLLSFKQKSPDSKISFLDVYPLLHEKVSFTPFDAHYFFQQIWVFKNVLKVKPKEHVDVASTYQMSGYLSTIVPTTFIDLRPIDSQMENLTIKRGDILNLPYKDNEVRSLSCLHVIEHIGLGRYGDPIDPDGTKKACEELARVLSKGGRLYLSTPIGKNRICFNAHHIHTPEEIIGFCKNLKLVEFSVIDDNRKFKSNTDYHKYNKAEYSCGLFEFTK